MKKGDYANTPRFCTVRIKEMYETENAAWEDGFTEPTYYEDPIYGIRGRVIGLNQMEFAAFKRKERR